MIDLLVRNRCGANVNHCNKKEENALYIAAKAGLEKTILYLKSKGLEFSEHKVFPNIRFAPVSSDNVYPTIVAATADDVINHMCNTKFYGTKFCSKLSFILLSKFLATKIFCQLNFLTVCLQMVDWWRCSFWCTGCTWLQGICLREYATSEKINWNFVFDWWYANSYRKQHKLKKVESPAELNSKPTYVIGGKTKSPPPGYFSTLKNVLCSISNFNSLFVVTL